MPDLTIAATFPGEAAFIATIDAFVVFRQTASQDNRDKMDALFIDWVVNNTAAFKLFMAPLMRALERSNASG